jgi:hypothetical protein
MEQKFMWQTLGTFDIPGNTVSVIDTSTNTAEATNSDLIGSKTKASVNKHKLENHSKHHKTQENVLSSPTIIHC